MDPSSSVKKTVLKLMDPTVYIRASNILLLLIVENQKLQN